MNKVHPGSAEHVTEKLVASFCNRIFSDVEEGLVVVGPGETGDALDSFRKELARPQIFYLQNVLSIAGIVSGVSE